MASPCRIKSFHSDLSESSEQLVARISTWLVQAGRIHIDSVDSQRIVDRSQGSALFVRIGYRKYAGAAHSGHTWRCHGFRGRVGSPIENDITAFYSAPSDGEVLYPIHHLDCGDRTSARSLLPFLAVLSVRLSGTLEAGFLGSDASPIIVRPTATIAMGATGTCSLLNSSGQVAATGLTIRAVYGDLPINVPATAVHNDETGEWQAVPAENP